ncbi:Spondin N [Mariniflexile rhizosphaerae]|uniref:T9SS type A sorting domain-containing protein n=1 Tax=unclassified Mariniflexile TaxID=2643887 RepID=UPI000CB2C817|nr:spondin domain-containing protein [Mariniflexile sp. TRM1-10]AXP81932.1 Spondin N [Mariniflexile sp. TRM1-10]PLB18045.1 MAG: Spondin domain-containing protein [Flavobacteriaceae bacterium FS1-H7996/R]
MKNITLTLFFGLILSVSGFGQSTADYSISLTTIWNATDHTSVPEDAHWSELVGATHNTANAFFELGVVSPNTDGIKDMAELGNNTNFMSEVNTAISTNKADQWINAGNLAGAVGTFSIDNLQVSENFPLITLVSMVAPSPDWFIAVNSIDLRSGNNSVNNGWKDSFTLDVFAYDAGTDDGTDYTSANAVSNPRVGVFKITGAPINGNKMGTITFTYNASTLNTVSHHPIETIKIFPNPTKGHVTVSNIQNSDLKSIQLYNVLGRLVKDIPTGNSLSKINLNLTNLSKGLYLFKLNSMDGKTKTSKLIVK